MARVTYLLIDRGDEFDESPEYTGSGDLGLALPLEPELRLYVDTEAGRAVSARVAVELEGWLFSYRLHPVGEEWQLVTRTPEWERPDTWGWLPVCGTYELTTDTASRPSKKQVRAAGYERFYRQVRTLLDGLTMHDLTFEAMGAESSLSRMLEGS